MNFTKKHILITSGIFLLLVVFGGGIGVGKYAWRAKVANLHDQGYFPFPPPFLPPTPLSPSPYTNLLDRESQQRQKQNTEQETDADRSARIREEENRDDSIKHAREVYMRSVVNNQASFVDIQKTTGNLLLAKKETIPLPAYQVRYDDIGLYSLAVVDSKTYTEQKIGAVLSNPWMIYAVLKNDTIYFSDDKGGVNTFNVKTKNIQRLELPKTGLPASFPKPDPSFEWDEGRDAAINNFIIRGEKIFYLQGSCSERLPCALHSFDFSTGKHEVLRNRIETSPIGGVFLYDYLPDKNVIRLLSSSADAGYQSAEVQDVHRETKLVVFEESAVSKWCGPDGEYCTDEDRKENKRWEAFIQKYPNTPERHSCGETEVRQKSRDSILTTKNIERRIENSFFIDCFDSLYTRGLAS